MKLWLRQGEMMGTHGITKKKGGRKETEKCYKPQRKRVNSDSITFPIPGLQAGVHLTQSLPLESSPAVTHR